MEEKRLYTLSNVSFEIDPSLENTKVLGDTVTHISQLDPHGKWLILLFCGWYGNDVKAMKVLLDYSKKRPQLKIGVKNYLDEEEIFAFYQGLDSKLGTPCYIYFEEGKVVSTQQGRVMDEKDLKIFGHES